jgi:CheY-like chemotaxis protein
MPNGLASVSSPILIIDDVASEALTLDLLCRASGVETISVAEAGDILSRLRRAATITELMMPGTARSGVPHKPPQRNLH